MNVLTMSKVPIHSWTLEINGISVLIKMHSSLSPYLNNLRKQLPKPDMHQQTFIFLTCCNTFWETKCCTIRLAYYVFETCNKINVISSLPCTKPVRWHVLKTFFVISEQYFVYSQWVFRIFEITYFVFSK